MTTCANCILFLQKGKFVLLSSSTSPLCRVFILIFLRQTVTLRNTLFIIIIIVVVVVVVGMEFS